MNAKRINHLDSTSVVLKASLGPGSASQANGKTAEGVQLGCTTTALATTTLS